MDSAGAAGSAHDATVVTQDFSTEELQAIIAAREAQYQAEAPARHIAALEAKVEKAQTNLDEAKALLASERDRYAAEAAARDQEAAAEAEEGIEP